MSGDESHHESALRSIVPTSRHLRVTLCLATLVMLGLSWPLWIVGDDFPRVPFVTWLPESPPLVSRGLFGLLLGAISLAAVGWAWRVWLGISLTLLTVLILQDQHRFQPWAYQFLMTGLLLATLSTRRGLVSARWWLCALYGYSGLSKLDMSFCRGWGSLFLQTAGRPLGLTLIGEPTSWQVAAILAMPAFEIAVGIALAFSRTRTLGLLGAILLHTALIGLLGPWGMDQSTIVLVWNAALIVEVVILFGIALPSKDLPGDSDTRLGAFARAILTGSMILPMGERIGLCDVWPAHAYYASHVERTEVYVFQDDLAEYPPAIRRHVDGRIPRDLPWRSLWRPLDLTAWSREVRGVPVYPQGRACNGLAEALAARYGNPRLIRVVHLSRADPWTGQRTRLDCLGLEAIRRQGDRYWLNAHPAGAITPREGPPKDRSPIEDR